VLVDAKGNPAYAATAGYDLATGLGSVNATTVVKPVGVRQHYEHVNDALPDPTTGITHGNPVNVNVE